MIKIDIRLPGATERIEIQNDCTGDSEIGNYNVQVWNDRVLLERIYVEGHRRELGYEALLAMVFEKLAERRCGTSGLDRQQLAWG